MSFTSSTGGEAEDALERAAALIYRSYNAAKPYLKERRPDREVRARHVMLTRRLLDAVGAPDRAFPSVLVLGSKGKGSTAVMVAALLQATGRRVGLFTSPHLVSLNERIRLNGRAVPPKRLAGLLDAVSPHLDAIEKALTGGEYVSPISPLLAAACLHFRSEGADIAVVECGRGGPYDPTHALVHPWVAFTEILTEHVAELGPTVAAIAGHKAGVIGPGVRAVFCGSGNAAVARIIERRAIRAGASVSLYGRDFRVSDADLTTSGVRGRIWAGDREIGRVSLTMLGAFQMRNAALAVQVAEAVAGPLRPARIRDVLRSIRIAGRCQVVGNRPPVLLDGSIHRWSAACLGPVVELIGAQPVIGVMAVPVEKDHAGVLEVLLPICDRVITTEVTGSGFVFPKEEAALRARRHRRQVTHVSEAARALAEAAATAGPSGLVLAVGVQPFVGAVCRLMGVRAEDLWGDPAPWDAAGGKGGNVDEHRDGD